MNQKNWIKLLLLAIVFVGQHSFAQVTPATLQQIQLLLNEKNSRTPAQRKIDSRLLQAVREKRGEKMAQGVDLDPADVDADATGLLKVDIKADISDAFLAKITALGGKIIFASAQYHTVRASLNLSAVETIAGYPEVKFIEPQVKSMVVDLGTNKIKRPSFEARVANVRSQLTAYLNSQQHPLIGKVTSEGDADHRAADVRTTYGFMGQGIKVGVLSDSYNAKGGAAADVASGDLPGAGNPDGDTTAVTVVQDYSSGDDEGRAMLQVIHDLAPKAQLFFATADVSEAGFATNIQTLRNTYHCDIILDDVGYFDEPAFQDGVDAQAVNTVTAAGALYFSAAGNSGSLKDGTSGVFEGDFNDAGSAAFSGSTKAGTIHNFGTVSSPVNGDIITEAGEVYNLMWSDPWGASGNDYDLFLVSSAGKVKKSSTNVQSGTQDPYEQITPGTLASGDRLVVFKTTSAAVRALHLNTNRGTLTVATNGQTTGHACAVSAFCMAATPATTAFETGYPTGPYPNPFVSTNKVEPFSSDGPRRMFYNADGTAITSGNVLFGTNGGTSLAKPDLTAADGVTTTFKASTGLSPFFGTSCAAPHAGAIAALLLSGNPSLTPAQVRTILTSTALDIEGTGYEINSGYGIIQAFQAAGQVSPAACGVPGTLTTTGITSSTATLNWGSVSNANSYAVDYKVHTASTWTSVATATTAITANLTSLSASTLYDWRVKSTCSSGTSAYDTAQFTTTAVTACGIPSGLAAKNITTATSTVNWAAVSGANNYDVDYKTDVAATWTNAVTATTADSVNLSGLTASTLYDYRVRSNCSSGTSVYDTAKFTTASVVTSCNSTYDGTTHNSFATAVAIPLSTNINGTISSATDVDYYKFVITKKGTGTITLTTLPADYDLYLYNPSEAAAGSSIKSGTASETINKTFGSLGTFYVKVIGYKGAFNTTTCYTLNVTLGTATGTAAERYAPSAIADNSLHIFPNPVTSVLNVSTSAISAGSTIKVIDIFGKTILSKQATSSNAQINVSKLPGGTYLLMIVNKDGSISKTSKFVKQ